MRLAFAFFCLATLLLAGADTLAQEAKKNDADVTKYDMESEVVEGERAGTEGVIVTAGPKRRARSLIKIRRHYIPEMLKSVEDL